MSTEKFKLQYTALQISLLVATSAKSYWYCCKNLVFIIVFKRTLKTVE